MHVPIDDVHAQQLLLEASHRIAGELTRSPDLGRLLELMLELLAPLVPFDCASAQLCELAGMRVASVAGPGANRADIGRLYPFEADALSLHMFIVRRPLMVPEVSRSPWAERINSPIPLQSWLGLPLIADDSMVGMLTFDRAEHRPFSSTEIRRGESFAMFAALAVRQAQVMQSLSHSEERLRQQARTLELLSRVQTAIGTYLEVLPLVRSVVDSIVETLGYTAVCIYLLEDEQLRLQHAVGYDGAIELFPATAGLFGQVVATGCAVLQMHEPPAADGGARSTMVVPLRRASQVCGVLGVEGGAGVVLSEEDLRLLETLGAQISVALERAMLYEDATHHAADLAAMLAELRQAQDRLVQAAKLAAVGTLAAGVAHEFNNLLAGMLGHAELARFGDVAEKDRALDLVVALSNRGKLITRGLLSFAHPQPAHRECVSLVEVADAALQLVEHDLRNHQVQVERHDDPRAVVLGDQTQLIQVVLNLLTNARDAMIARGGKLVITTACDGQRARLTVADTGTGVAPEIRDRLFEPFVTTKGALGGGALGGSGLGLAICYGIVQSLGGEIEVESSSNEGSRFHVLLPLVTPVRAGTDASASAPAATRLTGRRRRILVADDEPSVRSMVARALQRDGHEVVAVADGQAALHACLAGMFDLLITDLSMPGLDGAELVRTLHEAGYGRALIVMTGQLDPRELARLDPYEPLTVLVKPFQLHELRSAVLTKLG